jgi:hypothetical protein
MFDENGKFVMPCEPCKWAGIERAAGPGYVAGYRGYPIFCCPDHGGKDYDHDWSK